MGVTNMLRRNTTFTIWLTCCITAVLASGATAQTPPWQVFVDGQTSQECALINADNVELVVNDADGKLIITSSLGTDLPDTVLVDSQVDANGNVFIGGLQAGVIRFAEDINGTLGLWWVSALTGRVVRFDTVNNLPLETDGYPGDAVGDLCDPCEVWDDQTVCDVPVDDGNPPPVITINFCGTNAAATMMLTLAGLVGMRCTRRPGRRRV